jgi:hypothetical protein
MTVAAEPTFLDTNVLVYAAETNPTQRPFCRSSPVRKRVPATPVVQNESRAASRSRKRRTSQSKQPPNIGFQRTPLRVDKIGAILSTIVRYDAFSISTAARLMGKPLGRSQPVMQQLIHTWM